MSITYKPTVVLWRRSEVQAITGLRRSTLYQLIKDGKFPAPVKLSIRAVAWPSYAVNAWIASRTCNGQVQSDDGSIADTQGEFCYLPETVDAHGRV